jgi:ABC-type glycerol-3-phosphate transport system substrate-binding protein
LLHGKDLHFKIPSSQQLISCSFISVLLVLLVTSLDNEGASDSQSNPFLEVTPPFVAFASTDGMNSSYLSNGSLQSEDNNETTITLKGLLTDLGDKGRWKSLLDKGLEKLQQQYPDKNLRLEYLELPTNDTREEFLQLMSNKSAIDFLSVDQIWLGEFASKGLLSNLTAYADAWGRAPNWYQ